MSARIPGTQRKPGTGSVYQGGENRWYGCAPNKQRGEVKKYYVVTGENRRECERNLDAWIKANPPKGDVSG